MKVFHNLSNFFHVTSHLFHNHQLFETETKYFDFVMINFSLRPLFITKLLSFRLRKGPAALISSFVFNSDRFFNSCRPFFSIDIVLLPELNTNFHHQHQVPNPFHFHISFMLIPFWVAYCSYDIPSFENLSKFSEYVLFKSKFPFLEN